MFHTTAKLGLIAALLGTAISFDKCRGDDSVGSATQVDVPADYDALWRDYDPRSEPLEIETLEAWEEDGVTLRVVRFRVAEFKGKVARVAGVWGYPTGGENLPALLQIHGGGQYADAAAVRTNAARGYATLSLAWAGRINSSRYRVGPDEVRLFWDGSTDDPRYRVTTDWAAVDGYHAPSRHPRSAFPVIRPSRWTIDAVDSPRNSGWYLAALAARRGLTFLEQQSIVDAERLGVYGHSMGGKLTVMTAVDHRVKAAAPSCGGISDLDNDDPLFRQTLGDDVYLKRIKCPIFFLSPSNDFHGRIDDLSAAVNAIQSDDWRVTCSPHHNHQDTSPHEVATQIWFDRHLKNAPPPPRTPECRLRWDDATSRYVMTIAADATMPIQRVDVYHTRHGKTADSNPPNSNSKPTRDDRDNTVHRFWFYHSAERIPAEKSSEVETGTFETWQCEFEISGTERPLWVYANVIYQLPAPIRGAGYYYRVYDAQQFVLSSLMQTRTPAELTTVGVSDAKPRQNLIEDFGDHWQRQWFTYRENEWPRRTHKVYEPRWAAPGDDASLCVDVQSDQSNTLVITIDRYAAEVRLHGGPEFQTVHLTPNDFVSADDETLSGWAGIRELGLGHMERLRGDDGSKKVGGRWRGDPPQFRNLRWSVGRD